MGAALQCRHAGGSFAHYNPAEVARSDKTNAEATVDGVPLTNPESGESLFQNDSSNHAEIKIINAFRALNPGLGPKVLSIRINRVPCDPCAQAITKLLNDYPQLAVRIKASAITKPGQQGLARLNQHPRAFVRYWTTGELNAKGLIFKGHAVTSVHAEAWAQFKKWAIKVGMQIQGIETILDGGSTPKDKATSIKSLFQGLISLKKTNARTVNNYTDGLIRALYPSYKDQTLAPHAGNWTTRHLTRAEIVTRLRPIITITDPAVLLKLQTMILGGSKGEFTARESQVDFQNHPALWGGEYREQSTNALLRINDQEVDGMDPTIWFQLL